MHRYNQTFGLVEAAEEGGEVLLVGGWVQWGVGFQVLMRIRQKCEKGVV